MRCLIQRVRRASVDVGSERIAEIGSGLLVFVGVERGDGPADAHICARKIRGLRIFPGAGDSPRPMDRSVSEVQGAVLVVSQFTLAASLRKGRRPSFDRAEDPPRAEELYLAFAKAMGEGGLEVQTGRFGAHMEVDLLNDGPVTLWLRSESGVLL